MGIEAAPHCLSWSGHDDVWLTTYGDFVGAVSDRFARLLLALEAAAPDDVSLVRQYLSAASDDVFMRFVTAPEVTHRILWQRPSADTVQFFLDTLEAELSASGRSVRPSPQKRWSSLGDFHVAEDGDVQWQIRLDSFPPLDLGSPYAENMARSEGFVEVGTPETRGFSDDESQSLADALARTRDAIATVSPEAHRFVVTFNRVLILQRDPGAPDAFASGSTRQYIGRSFLSNPQLAFVDEAQLADAVVHEGIHGFLYALELSEPWVLRDELYDTTPVLESPWTGNRLAVRPFLQACFVWFGLANFFARALTGSVLPMHRAKVRLNVATAGFLRGDLLAILEPYRPALAPAVVGAIGGMQQTIRSAFQE